MTKSSQEYSGTSSVKLTSDEHRARAMLLGRWYADKSHTYFKRGDAHPHIDADTLEPLKGGKVYERYRRWQDANP